MKLILKATVNNWEFFKQRKRSKTFRDVRSKVLSRDKNTCRFCGFRGPGTEVINADNNYQNNRLSNLITACSLCAKATLLDAYALDYEGNDKIIYLPELTQERLNQLIRLLFCSVSQDKEDSSESAYNAKIILAQLQDRANWLDDKTGCQLSHPALFAHYLEHESRDSKLLQRCRLLPDFEGYKDVVQKWKKALA